MISSISFQWFHWFDFFVIAVVGIGVYLGRYGTALQKIVGFIHWLLVLLICSFLYRKPAFWMAEGLGMRPDTAALIIYPLAVAVVYFALRYVRKSMMGASEKEEAFGHWEYRVARVAGAFQIVIILLVAMAWINGRYVTEADLQKYEAFCQENFGSIRWPTPSTVRRDVMDESFIGTLAGRHLSYVLVTPFAPLVPEQDSPVENTGSPKQMKLAGKGRKGAEGADALGDEFGNGKGKTTVALREGETREGQVTDPALAAEAAKSGRTPDIAYHKLTLKGISGVGSKRLALINNQALSQGEVALVKVESKKVNVRCEEIRDSSVLIRVEDSVDVIELKLATNSLPNL